MRRHDLFESAELYGARLSERKALQRVINEPVWLEPMARGRWYRLSGDHPDLELPPTARGTRYLIDTDPARDKRLNHATEAKEILRRLIGRRPFAHWQGRCGFPAITEAWNGAAFASQFRTSGSMIVFGGGHHDYFGSSVHAFDLGTREWLRISDGYISGGANDYGQDAVTLMQFILMGRLYHPIPMDTCNTILSATITYF